MNRLNDQHLFYFWIIVKEGGVTPACEKLHLAQQPTISGKLAVFVEAIGKKLYYKKRKETYPEQNWQVDYLLSR